MSDNPFALMEDEDDNFDVPLIFHDDDDDEFSLSDHFSNPFAEEEDEDDFELPDSPSAFSNLDEDEDVDVFSLVLQNTVTSLSEFVISDEDEVLNYQALVQRNDELKGIKKVTEAVISDRIRAYLESRLKSVYPGYRTSFTSPKYNTRQNLIEYLRAYVAVCATEKVQDGGEGFNYRAIQRYVLDIFLNEKISIPDSTSVVQKIADVTMDAYNITVNDVTANEATKVVHETSPIYPKHIYPNGYVCGCGFFQKTIHPMPALIINNADHAYHHEQVICENCNRDIVVPTDVSNILTELIKATVREFPKMPKNTFCIYRPPLDSIQVPPHLADVLLFDDFVEEEADEYVPNTQTSLYKELVNSWTREQLSKDMPYITQIFNSKTFNFDVEQEWKDWSATLVHYLEDNGVCTLTPWAVARYHYTQQPHMDAADTHEFLLQNFHWVAGVRLVKSTQSYPDFLEDLTLSLKFIFILRCLAKTRNWLDKKLSRLMNNDEFGFSTVTKSKSGEADCSKGLAYLQDKNILPSVKVFEDYDTLVAFLSGTEIPEIKNEFVPTREHFPEFRVLLFQYASNLFATSLTDLYIVQRVKILNLLNDAHKLNEPATPSFENHTYLGLANKEDYRLITYVRLSENLPPELLDARLNMSMDELISYLNNNDELMQDLDILNPEWREIL